MNGLFKGLIAGWGASKIGGGCLGTIVAFCVIYWLLGTCDNKQALQQDRKQHRNTTAYQIVKRPAPAHIALRGF